MEVAEEKELVTLEGNNETGSFKKEYRIQTL